MPRRPGARLSVAVLTAALLLVPVTLAATGNIARAMPGDSRAQPHQTPDLYRAAIDETATELLPGPAHHRPGRPRLPGAPRPPARPPVVAALPPAETRCGPFDATGRTLPLTSLGAWRTSATGRVSLAYRAGSTAERDLEAVREVVTSTLLLVEEVLGTPPLADFSIVVHESAESIARLMGTANPHFDGRSVHIVCGWPVNLTALAHETAHAVSRLNFGLRAPALLGEGLAVWVAPRVLELALERELPLWSSTSGPQYYLSALSGRTLPSVQSLVDTNAFSETDATLAYGTASLVVAHLIEQHGLDRLWALWAEGDRVEGALFEHYGLTWTELDAEYRATFGLDPGPQAAAQRPPASTCDGAIVRIGSALPAPGRQLADGPVAATARGSYELPDGCADAGELLLHIRWVYERDGNHFLGTSRPVLSKNGAFFVSAAGSDTAGGGAGATYWALSLDGRLIAAGE
ncbi:MAG: hypothetical protein QF664_03395 [Dehalococcoidia bacterium]|jgi:hypothetical protein|nr:hypothetical protein [Dehalococcoidia bacterium]